MGLSRRELIGMIGASGILMGCGGQFRVPKLPVGDPDEPVPIVPKGASVFNNVPQTWNYRDGYGHGLSIIVTPYSQAFGSIGNISVWHYVKDSQMGYWNPRTAEQAAVAVAMDELYFVLRLDPDGAWRCIGFTYVEYTGQKWKVQILHHSSSPPAYTIIPVDSATSDPPTAYDALVQPLAPDTNLLDFNPLTGTPNFTSSWQTIASADGAKLVSLQHEGCVTEKWTFGNGLEIIQPLVGIGNGGACLNMGGGNPKLTMVRVG